MERETRLAQSLSMEKLEALYDHNVKVVLANKAILAWILKECVDEFKAYNLDTIESAIEGEPDIAGRAVHQNQPDKRIEANESILGMNSEDKSQYEKAIYYDIRFTALVPGGSERVELFINIEAQNKTRLQYPLEKRIIYYMSRMISGQYGTRFQHSEYQKLSKVYSIWFCTESSGEYPENTITGISMKNEKIYGEGVLHPKAVDMMKGIIVNVGDAEDRPDSVILQFMNILLSKTASAGEKKKVLEEEYHIAMTERLEKEVSGMCNLSQGIRDIAYTEGEKAGIAIGKSEGIAIGKSEGIAIGKSEGIAIGKSEGMIGALIQLVRDGILTGSDAARRAGMSEAELLSKAKEYGMM